MKNRKPSQATRWFFYHYKLSGFLAFILLLTGISYILFQRYHILKEEEKLEMSHILSTVEQNIDQTIKNGYATALSLALTINDQGVPTNFENISQKLVETNPNIDIFELLPNGIIKYVQPLKGNEEAMNINVLQHTFTKRDALAALKSKKMYFSGPVKLRQGGIGFIGRLPVFKQNKFWGFSAIIIRLDKMIKASGIENFDASKYDFQFSKVNEDTGITEYFLPKTTDFSNEIFQKISIADGNWNVYVIHKNKHTVLYELFPLGIIGISFSIVFGFFIGMILKKPSELEEVVSFQANKILKSEIEFNTIFEQASVGITHIDEQGKFIATNKQFCKILGYTEEEMIENNFAELTHPDDIEENLKRFKELESGVISEFSYEKRYLHKNKDSIWAKVHVYPVINKEENKKSYLTIIEDISEKKRAQESIEKSETRYKSLFEDSPVALWEEDFSLVKKHLESLDLIGRNEEEVITYLNSNPEEVNHCITLVKIININNECLTLHYPKTKEQLMEKLDNVLDNKIRDTFIAQLVAITQRQKYLSMDSKFIRYNGESRDISLRWSVMRGYEENLERVIISTEDITDRKASEELIINSQKKIESIVNAIDGIVWECEFDTYLFTYVNKKAEEITGYSTEEWLSEANFWKNTIHPEDRDEVVRYCFEQSKINMQYDFEYRMIAKNGNIIWIRDIVNVVHENGKPVSLKGIMIDITTKKRAEQELSDSFDLITEQNERLLNFSYIVSHNLRSHASNIQAISNLIENVDSDEERMEMIEMLQKVSSALNESMTNLNEVVNIQTNKSLAMKKLNLRENIEKITDILSEQIILKNAEMRNNVDETIFVNYNHAYLESILLNFISNALRYSHPERTPLISLDCTKENGKIILKISDNGMGINLERDGNKLFGMYKTFHKNPDSKGMGLFITKNQIDAMGGSVVAESEPNVGTTFIISFK